MKKYNIFLIMTILLSIVGWVALPKSLVRKVMLYRFVSPLPPSSYRWNECGISCGVEVLGKVSSNIGPNQLVARFGENLHKVVFTGSESTDLYSIDKVCRNLSINCRPREHINWNEIGENEEIKVLVDGEISGVLYGRSVFLIK